MATPSTTAIGKQMISVLVGWCSFIDCLMVQLAAHSRLYRIQIRRVSKRRVTCSTPANPRSSCSCLSVLHPTLRPRFETLGHRIHEKTARQSQHHSYLGQSRHYDSRRMHLFQETGTSIGPITTHVSAVNMLLAFQGSQRDSSTQDQDLRIPRRG